MDAETKDLCTALRDGEALHYNGVNLAAEAAELIETLCERIARLEAKGHAEGGE